MDNIDNELFRAVCNELKKNQLKYETEKKGISADIYAKYDSVSYLGNNLLECVKDGILEMLNIDGTGVYSDDDRVKKIHDSLKYKDIKEHLKSTGLKEIRFKDCNIAIE